MDEQARRTGAAPVLDHAFIAEHTQGFEAFVAQVNGYAWAELEQRAGLSRSSMEAAATVYARSQKVMIIYGMGMTQHRHGVGNVQMLVNLLLLRGNIGKPGAGICPVRGHSNVQGQRTVGITEDPAKVPKDKIEARFGFKVPTQKGMATVDTCKGIQDGSVKGFIGLGGNFLRAVPDTDRMEPAWQGLTLNVQVATKLNRTHLFTAQNTWLLPCLGRIETDSQDGTPQVYTTEDSTGCIRAWQGHAQPAGEHLRAEVAIIAGLAQATLAVDVNGSPAGAWTYDSANQEVTITSPAPNASITTAADGDRTVHVGFQVTDLTLRSPGTCLAGDEPCGHVRVQVDGDACNTAGGAFNSVAASSPAQAALGRCTTADGSHTVTLVVHRDDGTPWADADGVAVSAEVTVSATIPPLLERLGGEAGVAALADAVIAAQLEDPRINGYFRNASIDHDNMAVCMAEVFESFATGQPPGDADCELDMASVHAGLGVSTVDFDDWVENLETAMDGLGIAPADAAEFVAAVVPAGDDIIEDPDSNATLYQRLGRRPGIDHAVFHFVNKILMNPQVARYFLDADGLPDYSSTFNTCLVRLLGSLDGPFIYGEGFPLESTLADEGRACRDMAATHQNMTSAPPEEDPITGAEFLEVAGALVDALLYLQVPQEDIDLLVAAMNLPALCNAILGDPSECTLLFPPATSD